MTDRKYSVAEIDRMRRACKTLFFCSQGGQPTTFEQIDVRAEDMLRTYLIAGTDPDELYAHAMDEQQKYDKAMDWEREYRKQTAEKFAEKPKLRWWQTKGLRVTHD